MPSWAVSYILDTTFELLNDYSLSPKPDIPTPKEYEPPSPPSPKDLGPPPPGYGRYADFDRGAGSTGTPTAHAVPGNMPTGPRRNLDDVLCFKVQRFSTMSSAGN